jgi:hypothetical protein
VILKNSLTLKKLILLFYILVFPFLLVSQPKNLWPFDSLKGGWFSDTVLNEYSANNLYELVNGGADLYFEYGFIKVINGSFFNNGKEILVELFQMADNDAAYGIYSFYRSPKAIILDIGDEAALMDYYLSLRLGSYFITLTAYESDSISVTGLQSIAARIAEKGNRSGNVPDIMKFFSEFPKEEQKSLKYLKGKLGAMNQYHTTVSNMYNFSDGAVIFSDANKIFIFRHDSSGDCDSVFNSIIEETKLKEKVQSTENNSILYIDRNGKHVQVEKTDSYHILGVGDNNKILNKKIELLKSGLLINMQL